MASSHHSIQAQVVHQVPAPPSDQSQRTFVANFVHYQQSLASYENWSVAKLKSFLDVFDKVFVDDEKKVQSDGNEKKDKSDYNSRKEFDDYVEEASPETLKRLLNLEKALAAHAKVMSEHKWTKQELATFVDPGELGIKLSMGDIDMLIDLNGIETDEEHAPGRRAAVADFILGNENIIEFPRLVVVPGIQRRGKCSVQQRLHFPIGGEDNGLNMPSSTPEGMSGQATGKQLSLMLDHGCFGTIANYCAVGFSSVYDNLGGVTSNGKKGLWVE